MGLQKNRPCQDRFFCLCFPRLCYIGIPSMHYHWCYHATLLVRRVCRGRPALTAHVSYKIQCDALNRNSIALWQSLTKGTATRDKRKCNGVTFSQELMRLTCAWIDEVTHCFNALRSDESPLLSCSRMPCCPVATSRVTHSTRRACCKYRSFTCVRKRFFLTYFCVASNMRALML